MFNARRVVCAEACVVFALRRVGDTPTGAFDSHPRKTPQPRNPSTVLRRSHPPLRFQRVRRLGVLRRDAAIGLFRLLCIPLGIPGMREKCEEGVGRKVGLGLADLGLKLLRHLRRFAIVDPQTVEAVTRSCRENRLRIVVDVLLQTLPGIGQVALIRGDAGEVERGDVTGVGAAKARIDGSELLLRRGRRSASVLNFAPAEAGPRAGKAATRWYPSPGPAPASPSPRGWSGRSRFRTPGRR